MEFLMKLTIYKNCEKIKLSKNFNISTLDFDSSNFQAFLNIPEPC